MSACQQTSRPAFYRLERILARIAASPVTAYDLAREFGVTHKTIMRDLAFLRARGNALVYDAVEHRWKIERLVWPAPEAKIDLDAYYKNLLAAVDLALADPRYWFEWEPKLRAARNCFRTAIEVEDAG